MKLRYNSTGFILIEVIIATLTITMICLPIVSILINVHRGTVWAEDSVQALMIAQAQMETILAADMDDWVDQPYLPVVDHSNYEVAVEVEILPAALVKIRVLVRRRDASDQKTVELVTLATPKSQL